MFSPTRLILSTVTSVYVWKVKVTVHVSPQWLFNFYHRIAYFSNSKLVVLNWGLFPSTPPAPAAANWFWCSKFCLVKALQFAWIFISYEFSSSFSHHKKGQFSSCLKALVPTIAAFPSKSEACILERCAIQTIYQAPISAYLIFHDIAIFYCNRVFEPTG